jgi:ADP-dependent NAD(P)H-hydrate dehydratase
LSELVTQVPVLPPRPADSNKGNFGRVLVIAGSRGMSGAAILAGSAALRGGAGLVKVAVPHEVLPIVAAANPCYLTALLPQDELGQVAADALPTVLTLASANDVIAIGPGLGRSPAIAELVSSVLARTDRPVVLDADGLNALIGHTDRLTGRTAPLILTPHPGEFARLVGTDIATVQAQRQEWAMRFAGEHGLVLVLKGHGTVVTDGQRIYINSTGNAGMATGGTGDVLTGLIAALLGQKLDPFAAAVLGVHIHGLAGDLARDDVGEASLVASDLLVYLPRALRNF